MILKKKHIIIYAIRTDIILERESHAKKKAASGLKYSNKVTHETSPLKLLLLYVVGLKQHQKILESFRQPYKDDT